MLAVRHLLYSGFSRRADALFELTESILTAGLRPSSVHLSLDPTHNCGWGSLYAALSDGTVDDIVLRAVFANPLADEHIRAHAVDCRRSG